MNFNRKHSFILAALLLLPAFLSARERVYKNLVFEGGGIRGIAYAGSLKVLEDKGVLKTIDKVGGTSVGAIAALLVAVGYDAGEIKSVMDDLKVRSLNDGQYIFFGGFYRFFHSYGWYRGERFERWLGELIKAKTGDESLTFRQLNALHNKQNRFKDLYATGTNLSTQKGVVFSCTSSPDMQLKTAVRISMSIPLYFKAVLLDSNMHVVNKPAKGRYYDVMIDGGITANYPIGLFDDNEVPNKETLGLKLERPDQMDAFKTTTDIAGYKIHSMGGYVNALYNYVIENLNRKDGLSDEQGRTIYISTQGISPRVRAMRRSEKELLFNSGKDAAEQFFR